MILKSQRIKETISPWKTSHLLKMEAAWVSGKRKGGLTKRRGVD